MGTESNKKKTKQEVKVGDHGGVVYNSGTIITQCESSNGVGAVSLAKGDNDHHGCRFYLGGKKVIQKNGFLSLVALSPVVDLTNWSHGA